MREIKLKKCPFCGCRTVTFKQLAYERWSDVDEQAAEAWNRRAGEQSERD